MRLPDSTHSTSQSRWILRPSVILVLVYGTLLRFASLYFLMTLRYPVSGEDPAYGPGWNRLGLALSVLNLFLAGLLIRELLAARTRAPSLRRAHFAGAALGLIYLSSLQWLVYRAPDVFAALLPG